VKSLTIEAPFAGHVSLRADEWAKVEKSAQVVRQIVERGEPAYGINTGFGKLARVHIPDDQLAQLQVNLVRSHAVGVGPSLSAETVGVASFIKLKSLAKGFSGVRRETLERAIAIHNAGFRQVIPAQGLVGA
jgi:histidine ammonia-lyase